MKQLLATHGTAAAQLAMRIVFGGVLAFHHGLPKLLSWSEKYASFPDPLHVSPPVSLALTIFGELVCGVAVAAGFFTRIAAIPALLTLLVALFVVHGGDMLGKGELALVYSGGLAAVLLAGGGPWSVDALVRRRAP